MRKLKRMFRGLPAAWTEERNNHVETGAMVLGGWTAGSDFAPAAFRSRAQTATVSIAVDAAANRHKIDPRIYGLAYATPAQLRDLRARPTGWAATTRAATTGS